MENNQLVAVQSFCIHHKIESSFIESLQQYGLIEITTVEQQSYFDESQLGDLEKMVRLHYDMDINLEGIEAIGHLLEKLRHVQAINRQLHERLNLYENNDTVL